MKHHINSQERKNEAIRDMLNLPIDGSYSVEIKKLPKTRTAKQNRALHLYCAMTAETLNECDLSLQKVLEHAKVEINWNQDMVKRVIWSPVQEAITGTARTSKAQTDQYSVVYDHVNRFLSDKFGVSVPWPSEQGQ